jgi:hypothetical protein
MFSTIPLDLSLCEGSSSHRTEPGVLRMMFIHVWKMTGSSLSCLLKFAKTKVDGEVGRSSCARSVAQASPPRSSNPNPWYGEPSASLPASSLRERAS